MTLAFNLIKKEIISDQVLCANDSKLLAIKVFIIIIFFVFQSAELKKLISENFHNTYFSCIHCGHK